MSILNHLMKREDVMDLRLRLDFLMRHFMLLRSINRRETELADIFILSQRNKDIAKNEVNMLFILLRHLKILHRLSLLLRSIRMLF
jgi:hypothetical protein